LSNAINEAEQENANDWADDIKSQGWCWFTGNENRLHLWNIHTDAKNHPEAMYLKARKAGVDKNNAVKALEMILPAVEGTQFSPAQPKMIIKNGCTYVNTFKSQQDFVENIIDDCWLDDDVSFSQLEVFHEFLHRLAANDEDKEWLTCWMAHMIQKPEERPSVHPLFRTDHGVGKNVLVEQVLSKLLSEQTVTTSLKEIRNSHSESIANNLLVFVDESKAKGMNVYLEMKSMLTSKEMVINPKFVRPYKQELYSRFMFADNTEGRAFNIEQDDRRIYVCEYVLHEIDKEETQTFIQEFLNWWVVNWAEVYLWLKGYDISDWSPHTCPLTDAKKEYLEMCEDPLDDLITAYKESGRVTMTEFSWNTHKGVHGLGDDYLWETLHKGTSFKYKLEEAGYRSKKLVKRVNNSQKSVRAWVLNNLSGGEGYDVYKGEFDGYSA
jgi:hypothetical protein